MSQLYTSSCVGQWRQKEKVADRHKDCVVWHPGNVKKEYGRRQLEDRGRKKTVFA